MVEQYVPMTGDNPNRLVRDRFFQGYRGIREPDRINLGTRLDQFSSLDVVLRVVDAIDGHDPTIFAIDQRELCFGS